MFLQYISYDRSRRSHQTLMSFDFQMTKAVVSGMQHTSSTSLPEIKLLPYSPPRTPVKRCCSVCLCGPDESLTAFCRTLVVLVLNFSGIFMITDITIL